MDGEGRDWMAALAEQLTERIASAVRAAVDGSEFRKLVDDLAAALELEPEPGTAPGEADGDDPAAEQEGRKRCAEPGCDEPARARGLCSKHYQRLRYAEKRAAEEGEPLPTSLEEAAAKRTRKAARKTSKRGGGLCSVEGCERANYAKGMCGKHFMEWVRSRKG